MRFHVLTLFPDMVRRGLQASITGKAMENGLIELNTVNIRDYTLDRHKKVDDYPYGGGAGMVMQAQPVYDAWRTVVTAVGYEPRCVYLTPQGRRFDQKMAKSFAGERDLILLCGHYEGVDERVLEEIVSDSVSIGDYVLTGGELPAMVMVDAISRMIPGVLNNEESVSTESLEGGLLEYPQYSRPSEWRGRAVPPVLLSGNHQEVEEWRREQSVLRTLRNRPDLLEEAGLSLREVKLILDHLEE
ncbi:MAG: tRNA (guanosine(37)-N1)-methyltransferase TrmD [Clostridiales bacterium]|nr:tRNA (guanosine(37)-N1)-methyltransferase TrmD [Clostridiales bacterium]